jgi:hypothetical protein
MLPCRPAARPGKAAARWGKAQAMAPNLKATPAGGMQQPARVGESGSLSAHVCSLKSW